MTQYKYSGPRTPKYFTDDGRPTVGWIMKEVNREDYVNQGLLWSLEDMEEHKTLVIKEIPHQKLKFYENCVKTLNMAIEMKKKGDEGFMDHLKSHLYENYDLVS